MMYDWQYYSFVIYKPNKMELAEKMLQFVNLEHWSVSFASVRIIDHCYFLLWNFISDKEKSTSENLMVDLCLGGRYKMRIRKTCRKRIWKKRVTNGGILPFLKFIYFMNFSPSCIFKKYMYPANYMVLKMFVLMEECIQVTHLSCNFSFVD